MKAFKRSGARWFARSKSELIDEWRAAPVVAELSALSVEYCVLEPERLETGEDVLRMKPTHYTVDPAFVASMRFSVPRCRSSAQHLKSVVPCELHAQHAGDHMNDRLRWVPADPPWAELRGSPAERYRAGLLELVEARRDDPTKNDRDPAARDEEDRRCVALNDLWWRMSPAEQDAFEAWWQERLRLNTPGGLRRFERWLGVTYG